MTKHKKQSFENFSYAICHLMHYHCKKLMRKKLVILKINNGERMFMKDQEKFVSEKLVYNAFE